MALQNHLAAAHGAITTAENITARIYEGLTGPNVNEGDVRATGAPPAVIESALFLATRLDSLVALLDKISMELLDASPVAPERQTAFIAGGPLKKKPRRPEGIAGGALLVDDLSTGRGGLCSQPWPPPEPLLCSYAVSGL